MIMEISNQINYFDFCLEPRIRSRSTYLATAINAFNKTYDWVRSPSDITYITLEHIHLFYIHVCICIVLQLSIIQISRSKSPQLT